MPFLGLTLGRLMDLMEYLLPFLNTVTPCWHPALSNFSSSVYQLLPFLHAGSMPKKGDRSNPSSYHPIALISCLSKAFETILNRKFLKHLSSFNLLSDHQYGLRKGRSTDDLLAFLTDSWSSSHSRFGETFAVALNISKAFDRVWHKGLLSKLPFYCFYPALCSLLSSFLAGRSIAVADGHCSTPKPINRGVPQSSVLSPTLFYSSMIFPCQTVLSFPKLMTPLCSIPRPLTNNQIFRNCRYQGTMLQSTKPQTFL